jgi:hypothetical protein
MMSKEVVMRWLAALVLGALVGGGAVGRPGAEPSVVVRMEGDRLSVSAEEVPLKDIVAEIGRATSIKIFGEARLDPQVVNQAQTVGFHQLKVEEAFRRLLPDYNFVVVHSSDGIEIEIHAPGQRSQPASQGTRTVGQAAPSAPQAAPSAPQAAPSGPTDVRGDPTILRDTALSDPDPRKRAQAMSQLSRIPEKEIAGETALSVLDRDREPVVLRSALDALGAQTPVPIDPLIRFAGNNGQVPELRVRAIELLRDNALGNGQVQALLRVAAARDRSEAVQAAAKRILDDTGIQ